MAPAETDNHETFIHVAPDCPAKVGVVPTAKGDKKSIPVLQYELLAPEPYVYTQDDVLFEVHVRHKGVPAEEQEARREELRAAFFAKSHRCLRASPLAKTYGWGFHFNLDRKVALYPVESAEYQRLTAAKHIKQVVAMRSQRA